MCFHWQGKSAENLEKECVTWTLEKVTKEIITQEKNIVNIREKAKQFADERGYKLEQILSHGFYAGRIFSSELKIKVLNFQKLRIQGLSIKADLPPTNAIIIGRGTKN